MVRTLSRSVPWLTCAIAPKAPHVSHHCFVGMYTLCRTLDKGGFEDFTPIKKSVVESLRLSITSIF